jgi:hypothetical protein
MLITKMPSAATTRTKRGDDVIRLCIKKRSRVLRLLFLF